MSDVQTKCLTPLVDSVRHMSDMSKILSHALKERLLEALDAYAKVALSLMKKH